MHPLLSLKDLYDGRLFRIPDYQRGYAWETRQIEDFWDDIINLQAGHIHYTGVVTVERPTRSQCLNWRTETTAFADDKWKEDGRYATLALGSLSLRPYYVVDGQQRLLTIAVLLAAARECPTLTQTERNELANRYLFKNHEGQECFLFGYEVDLPSHRYLIQKIYKNQASDEVETAYTDNLLRAKTFFAQRIGNLPQESLRQLIRKVTANVQFNYYEIDEKLDVFVVFETMNNRGKKLSQLELLKNRLLFLSTLLQSESVETRQFLRMKINEAWRRIYEWLAKNRGRVLDDDDFLRVHWVMYFDHGGDTGSELGNFAEDLLNQRFVVQQIQAGELSAEQMLDYVQSLASSSEKWFEINFPAHTASSLSESLRSWLERINELRPQSFFRPIVMALLQSDYAEQDKVSLLRAIERHEFLVFALADSKATANRPHFWRQANRFFQDDIPLGRLIDDIRNKTSRFYSQKKFQDNVELLFNSGTGDDRGFPEWSYLKYFLSEYEEFLRAEREVLVRRQASSVERIYPKRVERGGSWNRHFDVYSPDSRTKLCNSVGNLILLARRRTVQEAEFDSFADKKRHPKPGAANEETGYFNGSYSEREVAEFEVWRHKEILERGVKLLGFMERRWEIPLAEDFRKTLTQVNFAIKHEVEEREPQD